MARSRWPGRNTAPCVNVTAFREATRRAFFDRVMAAKSMIAGYHFGLPNVGLLSKDGNSYAFAAVQA